MNCPACGALNEAGRKFCGECGGRLSAVCPSCGAANNPGSRFCGECGTAIGGAAAGASVSGAGATGPAATTASVGTASAPATAERRLVSILFVDLVGFTTLSEGRDHEEVRELLSRYFDVAREMIERYGGTVEKFIGDAVMAVWGAPTAHEDDAERAVRAALDVVDAVRGLAPGLAARGGVLTGEAAVTIGATNQGMVAGDIVNTASRLQSAAPSGVVLVGESTHRATSDAIAYEPAGEQLLKGKTTPVPAWRALRVATKRRGRGGGDRLEAPFVGRDSELRLLKDLFHATAREKRLRLVSITGQGGIGKSRLAWEFQKYLDGIVEKVLWHEGRSPAYGEGVTFWALGEMVRSQAGLLETDELQTTRQKVHDTVAQYVETVDRERVERALLALLGVAEAPPGGAEELFGAWRIYFEQMANTGMVALLFEDLHWADPGTIDFIEHVLEWSRNVPILIITLARPEILVSRPGWGAGKRNFLALDLEPLDDAAMRSLLGAFVPNLPEAAERSIIARADGIPLYAVETVRMLVADGRLKERPDGGFEPVGELGELSVPETLQALIAARLDGLDPADRALVQDAAVLGQSFAPAGLAAVSGMAPEELTGRLRNLARSDLLRELVDPRSPERGQYAFVQALIREVAYSTLSMRDRRSRHLAAARYFESLGDEEIAVVLATHYLAAFRSSPAGPEADALAAQARVSLRAAAERAEALGAPRQAVAFLQQALEVAADDEDRAAILERATEAALAAADHDRATELGARLRELREMLGDRAAIARAVALQSEILYALRQRDQSATVAREGLQAYGDMGEDPAVLRLTADLATSTAFTGLHEEATVMADRALAAAERLNMPQLACRMLTVKGSIAYFQGRLWEGIALTEGARRLAEQHGLTAESLRASMSLTNILALDDPRATVESDRQVIELARRLGRRDTEIVMLGNMSEDVRRVGDWDWIIPQVEAALTDEAGSVTNLILEGSLSLYRAFRGDLDEAAATSIIARVDALEDRDVATTAHDLRAILALTSGDYQAAVDLWLLAADGSQLNAPYALPKAGLAAVLAGDAGSARLVLERIAALGTRGRSTEADLIAIRAGLAALEGDRAAAMAGYRAARLMFHDLGLAWDEALTAISAGTRIGAVDAEVRAWLEDARSTMTRLRARPMLAIVELLLATPGSRNVAGGVASEAGIAGA